jgi:ferritin-like protein
MAAGPVTPEDATLAGFLQSIALGVADGYDKVTPFLSDTTRPIAAMFQSHHREHAAALALRAGPSAAPAGNPTLAFVVSVRMQGVADERSALAFAFDLEHQVTETYAFALTTLTSLDVVHLVATILPIVSGHAGILGSSAGLTTTLLFPNGALEGATVGDGSDNTLGFDPASFPVS